MNAGSPRPPRPDIATVASAAPPALASLTWQRRILVISAPDAQDRQAVAQRRLLADWTWQGADRDVSLVEVSAGQVSGVSDSADALRRRYRLDASKFAVLLIGKDGHVALRSAQPIAADRLEATIDAMPMRKAGQR